MKIRKLFAAVLALCLAACMIPTAFADDQVTIKVGVIGPMTGGAAVYGTAVARGAQIAANEINAANGPIRIELDIQDDEHDPEKAINAYNVLKDNGVQMILGTVTTAPCLAVSVKGNEDRMFMLTPSASAADVTANKNQTFQVCFTDPGQGRSAA